MRRYNIAPRILLILTAITFALAAPVLVQEKRESEACVNEVYVPEDLITVLGKRALEEDLDVLWENWWHQKNVLKDAAPPQNLPLPDLLEVQLAEMHVLQPNSAGVDAPEVHLLRPDLAEVQMSEPHVPPQGSANPDRESMKLGEDSPTRTSQSSLGSPTESDAPSAESQSENLKDADSELKDKNEGLAWYFRRYRPWWLTWLT